MFQSNLLTPQSPTHRIYFFYNLCLSKGQLHPSSCSGKQNSWCLFLLSQSPSENTVSFTLRYTRDLTTALQWSGESVICKGRGRPGSRFQIRPVNPPHVFLQVHSPFLTVRTESSLRSHRMKTAESSACISKGQSPCWPETSTKEFQSKILGGKNM